MTTRKRLRQWTDSESPARATPTRIPVQTTFRHMPPSPAVAARVDDEVQKLRRYCETITKCHVVIVAPHQHHRHGRQYEMHLELSVPGSRIVINHEPAPHARLGEVSPHKAIEVDAPHKDIYVVIREVFDSTRRRLEDYVRRIRGDVKRHATPERPAAPPEA